MAIGKPPAFQFYPDSWLSSQDIMLMSPAEEGAYIRLLAISWLSEDCGLPDDDDVLSRLSRLGEAWFKGGSTVLRNKFEKRDGRLYNLRLLEERKKQEEWRVKSSEGGKKSAKLRWGHKKRTNKGGYKMVKEWLQPNCNLSSPSSSPSSKEEVSLTGYSISPQNSNENHPSLSEVIDLFNSTCTTLPKAFVTETRKNKWRPSLKSSDIGYWKDLFSKAHASDFLSGRSGKWTGCAFDWFASPGNRQKVIEGTYNRASIQNGAKKQIGPDDPEWEIGSGPNHPNPNRRTF